MSVWEENGVAIDIVDEKNNLATRNQNWAFGARVVGNHNKKLLFLQR